MKPLVNKIYRYLRLYLHFLKFSFQDVLIYRVNALMFGLAPIIWMVTMLILIATIFSKVKQLGTWSFWELIFLTGTHEIIFTLTWCIFWVNLTNFPNLVKSGRLDQLLLKPVNPRFVISFRYFDFSVIFSAISTAAVFLVSLYKVLPAIISQRVPGFILLMIMAYLICYLMRFIFSSLSLFFISTRYLSEWIGELTDFDRYPAEIYSSWLRAFLLLGLPILFFAYVPTAYLLGKIGEEYIVLSLFISCILYLISRFLWHAGLRRYSSASS